MTNILFYVPNPYVIPVALLGFIDYRAGLDEAVTLRDETAVEPYLFTREAYLQYRKFLIYDGNPPVDENLYFDDPFNDLEVEEPFQEENTQESSGPERVTPLFNRISIHFDISSLMFSRLPDQVGLTNTRARSRR